MGVSNAADISKTFATLTLSGKRLCKLQLPLSHFPSSAPSRSLSSLSLSIVRCLSHLLAVALRFCFLFLYLFMRLCFWLPLLLFAYLEKLTCVSVCASVCECVLLSRRLSS